MNRKATPYSCHRTFTADAEEGMIPQDRYYATLSAWLKDGTAYYTRGKRVAYLAKAQVLAGILGADGTIYWHLIDRQCNERSSIFEDTGQRYQLPQDVGTIDSGHTTDTMDRRRQVDYNPVHKRINWFVRPGPDWFDSGRFLFRNPEGKGMGRPFLDRNTGTLHALVGVTQYNEKTKHGRVWADSCRYEVELMDLEVPGFGIMEVAVAAPDPYENKQGDKDE